MKFKVLKVDDVDIKNGFYIGEIFEASYEVSRDKQGNIIDTVVFDSVKNRGIEVDSVQEL